MPRISALYSATLLVALPIGSAASAITVAVLVAEDDADRGGPGVAPGAAVHVDYELQAACASAWLFAMIFCAICPGTSW